MPTCYLCGSEVEELVGAIWQGRPKVCRQCMDREVQASVAEFRKTYVSQPPPIKSRKKGVFSWMTWWKNK